MRHGVPRLLRLVGGLRQLRRQIGLRAARHTWLRAALAATMLALPAVAQDARPTIAAQDARPTIAAQDARPIIVAQEARVPAGPLMIERQGSFFIGGREVKSDALSTLPAYAPSGTITVDQVYVRYRAGWRHRPAAGAGAWLLPDRQDLGDDA